MPQSLQTAVRGKPFLVDVGVFGKNRYFVYVAAFGAFTEVSYSTPQETKNILGHQAYMLEAIKRLTGLKSYRMRLTWEHLGEQRELEEEFILGMVTNTTSIGGFKGLVGMDVALDDGEFCENSFAYQEGKGVAAAVEKACQYINEGYTIVAEMDIESYFDKIYRKYLNHVQKSVFDGAITEGQLKRLKNELQQWVVPEEDTVCIYYLASSKYAGKEQIGTVLKSTNNI